MCIFIYVSVVVVELSFVMLLGHGIEPACGHTRLRE